MSSRVPRVNNSEFTTGLKHVDRANVIKIKFRGFDIWYLLYLCEDNDSTDEAIPSHCGVQYYLRIRGAQSAKATVKLNQT
ncbi:hypothetical protein ACRRTK_012794 [Alexandromys fortis]